MKGRVYKLVNMITHEIYIGSTTQTLHQRHLSRKRGYRRWLRGLRSTDNHILYNNIYEYGWECFRMELIEEVEIKNKDELYAIEGDYIRKYDTFNNGLNKRIPLRSEEREKYDKNYYQENKDKIKQSSKNYYQENKDRINQQNREDYQKNKDTINQQKRERRKKNKDIIRQKDKIYRDKNKDKINQRRRENYQKNKEKIKEYQREWRRKKNSK